MSSILTNTSAMTALQTLKNINSNLETTQREISTGKSIGSAKDNAALWSISKVMEADVSGFKAIQDSLNLGEATLNVAQSAAESTGDLLNQIKEKVVTAQESNVDRTKIQADISQLREQIASVVGAAQFNGLNMLQNSSDAPESGTNEILASLDRAADGSVTKGTIDVIKQDLTQKAATLGSGTLANDLTTSVGGINDGESGVNQTATINTATAGATYAIDISAGTNALVGLNGEQVGYVARDGDTTADIASALALKFNALVAEGTEDVSVGAVANGNNPGEIEFISSEGDNDYQVTVTDDNNASTDQVIGGGLELLADLDVTTEAGARGALAAIEGLIQTSIDSAAELGSAANRVEVQSDFVGKLTDSFKAGIGSLVDANMEEASARLQALQTQQQLGVQALSIANSAPQNILSLFR